MDNLKYNNQRSSKFTYIFKVTYRIIHLPKFKNAKTSSIHKDGDTKEVKNWRPVSVRSVLRRMYEIIFHTIEKYYIFFNNTKNYLQALQESSEYNFK